MGQGLLAKVWPRGSRSADHGPDGAAKRALVCGGDQEAAEIIQVRRIVRRYKLQARQCIIDIIGILCYHVI